MPPVIAHRVETPQLSQQPAFEPLPQAARSDLDRTAAEQPLSVQNRDGPTGPTVVAAASPTQPELDLHPRLIVDSHIRILNILVVQTTIHFCDPRRSSHFLIRETGRSVAGLSSRTCHFLLGLSDRIHNRFHLRFFRLQPNLRLKTNLLLYVPDRVQPISLRTDLVLFSRSISSV